jgi:hypothetical protein
VIDDHGHAVVLPPYVESQHMDLDHEHLDAFENSEFQQAAQDIFKAAVSEEDPAMKALDDQHKSNIGTDGKAIDLDLAKKYRNERKKMLETIATKGKSSVGAANPELKALDDAQKANISKDGKVINEEVAKKIKKERKRLLEQMAASAKEKEKRYTLNQEGHMVEVDENGQVVKKAFEDARVTVAWRGPFSRTLYASRKYELDFSEVHEAYLKKKLLRAELKREQQSASRYLATRVHARLTKICEDIIYARKWLRLAFGQWKEAVGIETEKHILTIAEKTEAARLVAKKQMRTFLGKVQVQHLEQKLKEQLASGEMDEEDLHISAAVKAEMKRLEEVERQARRMRMSKEEIEAEDAAEREARERLEMFALHDAIVSNQKKEEEHYDEPNFQQAQWEAAYKDSLHLPIISGRYFRHEDLARRRHVLLTANPRVLSSSKARSGPAENIFQRPRTSEYLKDLPGGGGPGRLGRALSRPGTGKGRTTSPQHSRSNSPAAGARRPGTGAGQSTSRPGTANWSDFFIQVDPPPPDAQQSDEEVDVYERDKFFTNEIGESFLFPSLNVPGETSQRRSSPRKHYVFEQPRPPSAPQAAYDSDSSQDL